MIPTVNSPMAKIAPRIKAKKRLSPEEKVALIKERYGLSHGKGKRKKKKKKK